MMEIFLLSIVLLNINVSNGFITSFAYKSNYSKYTKTLEDNIDIGHLQSNTIKVLPFEGCSSDAFPPNSDVVSKYIVDLDLPPERRWSELIAGKTRELQNLVVHVEYLMTSLLGVRIFNFVNESLPSLAKTLPYPYYEEIKGIAKAANITMTQATMYNIFYEVFTVCTSIVGEDKQGNIFHGRNLDFGLFLGWDKNNHTWTVAEMLRPLVVQLQWQKSGKTIYESVSYVGFVGVITAMKKNAFSFSFDERFTWNGGYIGLLEWIIFNDHEQRWVSFLTREVMENANSFDEALEQLSKPRLLAPVYFIVGGIQPGQGAIITRFRDSCNIVKLGDLIKEQSSWFLVETNYDHWKSPPFYDDRRTPAIKCLLEAGQDQLSHKLLFNVLSTKPVLNKLTTYTSIMSAKEGYLGTWLQTCPDPCWPW